MKNINRNMLHMKLNSAVSVFAIAATFAVFLPPSNASAGVCFLPDCAEEDLAGELSIDINSDSKYCEENGYVSSCPENTARIPDSTCYRDENYFKCSKQQWCKDNGYNISSCSIPQYLSEQCPNGENLYKSCQTDNQRACQDLGYKNSCSSGQELKKTSGRCAYDSSYGTCCTPAGCPSNTSLTSSSYGSNGTNGCEYTCYYTCDPNCPSGTSTSNPGGCGGSTKNGCGDKICYYPYQSCCTPSCTSDLGYCSKGSVQISDGCGGTCTKCINCEIGYIYYSDKTCSETLSSSKTAIGNIISINNNKMTIIALHNGSYNISNGSNSVKTYSTAGTSAGDWRLPSLTEMNNLISNISTINPYISLAGGDTFTKNDKSYWTSNYGYHFVWYNDRIGIVDQTTTITDNYTICYSGCFSYLRPVMDVSLF